ncbi:hypothetical protein D3C71_1308390 [compost metagenome]
MLAMKVPSVFNEVWGAQEVPVRVYVKTALEDVVPEEMTAETVSRLPSAESAM